jgi:hypothetical protein
VFNLDPQCVYVALQNPLWAGGDDEGRVYAVDLVQFNSLDVEIARQQLSFSHEEHGFYPQMSALQGKVSEVNRGRIARR